MHKELPCAIEQAAFVTMTAMTPRRSVFKQLQQAQPQQQKHKQKAGIACCQSTNAGCWMLAGCWLLQRATMWLKAVSNAEACSHDDTPTCNGHQLTKKKRASAYRRSGIWQERPVASVAVHSCEPWQFQRRRRLRLRALHIRRIGECGCPACSELLSD